MYESCNWHNAIHVLIQFKVWWMGWNVAGVDLSNVQLGLLFVWISYQYNLARSWTHEQVECRFETNSELNHMRWWAWIVLRGTSWIWTSSEDSCVGLQLNASKWESMLAKQPFGRKNGSGTTCWHSWMQATILRDLTWCHLASRKKGWLTIASCAIASANWAGVGLSAWKVQILMYCYQSSTGLSSWTKRNGKLELRWHAFNCNMVQVKHWDSECKHFSSSAFFPQVEFNVMFAPEKGLQRRPGL